LVFGLTEFRGEVLAFVGFVPKHTVESFDFLRKETEPVFVFMEGVL
jgi:hypothetical protein